MTFIIIAIFLGLVMLIMAGIAIYHKSLTVAIIAAGVVSLFAAVMYLLLAAPDVAMTEASIGSGLSTIIFFYVLNKIRKTNDAK
ncbi:MAG: hydrogenase subunit MbhD domain-containing protein [Bacteroidota bacterium]|nr:hydrogenase subunit MbhD domain-containing protein [Bacteroidota bacterium]